MVNLAVADILFGTFMATRVFFKLTFNHPDGTTGKMLCKFITDGNVAWIAGASSFVTLVAIAIERYYAVMYPLGNRGKLTKRKLKVGHLKLSVNEIFFELIVPMHSHSIASSCASCFTCRLQPDRRRSDQF